MRKKTIKIPAESLEQLWEKERNGSEVLNEGKYYCYYCLTSIYLLEMSKCSRNH